MIAGLLAAPVPRLAAQTNLLANPDFEYGGPGFHGAAGFYTEYIEWPVSDRGAFSVRDNPNSWNGFFPACSDHTPGGLKMACFDGDTHRVVWAQTLNGLQPNSTYVFRFWWINLYADNPAILRVRFRPEPGSNWQYYSEPPWVYLTIPADCQWHESQMCWFSGNFPDMTIVLENVQSGETGVDFAIDDMEFGLLTCASPPQITANPPVFRMRAVGRRIVFSVDFQSNVPLTLSYPPAECYNLQWLNGTAAANGDVTLVQLGPNSYRTTLTINNVTMADRGWYTFTVTTPCGSATSTPARLFVVNLAPD